MNCTHRAITALLHAKQCRITAIMSRDKLLSSRDNGVKSRAMNCTHRAMTALLCAVALLYRARCFTTPRAFPRTYMHMRNLCTFKLSFSSVYFNLFFTCFVTHSVTFPLELCDETLNFELWTLNFSKVAAPSYSDGCQSGCKFARIVIVGWKPNTGG